MLKGKQKQLDKNKDGKISGEDFKMMKAKYGKMMKAGKGGGADIDYRLGTKMQGDYEGKTLTGKAKELLVTGVKQTKGSISELRKKILKKLSGTQVSDKEKKEIIKSLPKAKSGKIMKTRSVTVPPSKGFKKEVIDERYNTYPKRIDKKGKSRIVIDSELKEMNEKIKKKKESGKKDIFDYIGDVLKTPYKIRGGAKHGKMIKANMGTEVKSTQGYGAARTSGMGLQDEDLIPGKSMDYYKDIV